MLKLLVLSVACSAILVQPTHSMGIGSIASIRSAGIDAVRDIVSIVPKMIKAKTAAVVTGAADMASIFTTGLGLKIRALAKATASIKNAAADGFISVGDSFTQAGNRISDSLTGNTKFSPQEVRVLLKTPVMEEVKMSPVVVENVKMSPMIIEEDINMSPVVVEEDFRMSPVFMERGKMSNFVIEDDFRMSPVFVERAKMTPIVVEDYKMSPVFVERAQMSPVFVEEVKMSPIVVEEVQASPAVEFVEEEFFIPCEQEVVEVPVESYPIRTVQVNSRPSAGFVESSARFPFITDKVSSVWDTLKLAAESKVNSRGQVFNVGGSNGRSRVYDIVDTSRHQRPLFDTFQIAKK